MAISTPWKHKPKKANLNQLYNPRALLSGKQVNSLAHLLANLDVNPQVSALKHTLSLTEANDNALINRVHGYNSNLAGVMHSATQSAGDAQGKLSAALSSNTSSTLGALSQTNTNNQQFVKDDAALRGAGLDAGMGQRLSQDFQRQYSGVESNMRAGENTANTAAGSWAGLASLMEGASAMRSADTETQLRTQSTNREQDLQTKIGDLKGSKGALSAKYALSLRDKEFEKFATAEGLQIKEFTAKANASADKAALKLKKQQLKADKAWHAAQDRLKRDLADQASGDKSKALAERIQHDRATEQTARQKLSQAHGGKKLNSVGVPWLPAATHSKMVSYYQTAFDQVKQQIAIHGKNRFLIRNATMKDGNGHDIKIFGGLNSAILSAALDAAIDGHISPATYRKLMRQGIRPKALGVEIRTGNEKPPPYKPTSGNL